MGIPKSLPPQDELRRMFYYIAESGLLVWKSRADVPPQWNGKWAGRAVGSVSKSNGRLVTNLGGQLYLVHRLIWKRAYGSEPSELDHADGDPLNNRLGNLREASHSENMQNAKRHAGKALPKGVSICSRSGKFRADIYLGGHQRQLGQFDDPHQAHAAYCDAASKARGEFARFD